MRARDVDLKCNNCSANNTIKSLARSSRFRVFRADPDGIIRTRSLSTFTLRWWYILSRLTDRLRRRGWRRRAIIITAVCTAPLRIPSLTSIIALASVITWPLWSTNPSYLFKTAPFLLVPCVFLLSRLVAACSWVFWAFFEFSPLPWEKERRGMRKIRWLPLE